MKKPLACWGFALALLCSQKDANGDAVVTLSPADDNVVVEGGGTLNLAALTFDRTATLGSDVDPSAGTIILGPPHPSDLSMYTGLNMPRAFGGGGEIIADFVSGSGDLFGIGIGQSFFRSCWYRRVTFRAQRFPVRARGLPWLWTPWI